MQLPWFVLLGVASGAFGRGVPENAPAQRRGVSAKLKVPIYVRLAMGGLVVGLIASGISRRVGQWLRGHEPDLLHDPADLVPDPLEGCASGAGVSRGLLLAKLLATLATVGSGAVGGVFTPTLFLGASLGALFGLCLA